MTTNVVQQAVKKSGSTRATLTKLQYTWMINNFSYCYISEGKTLQSPAFTAGTNDGYEWLLTIHPNRENIDFLSLYLRLVLYGDIEVTAALTCRIFDERKTEIYSNTSGIPFNFTKRSLIHGFDKLMEKNYLLSKSHITIQCEITIVDRITYDADLRIPVEHDLPDCQLADDLSDLFASMNLWDVTLVACGKEFKAHKAILSARSPVFYAMFKHEMREKQQNRVEITDVDDQVLEDLLRFIYTGRTINLKKMPDALLAAADKYQLERLKSLCIKELYEGLTTENAASRLICSDLHDYVDLKSHILNFICNHTKEVLETASYRSMFSTHPHLLTEVILALTDK